MILIALLVSIQAAALAEAQQLGCDRFGTCVDTAADLNGDGVQDFWVGDPSSYWFGDPSNRTWDEGQHGKVWAVSGANGETLRRIDSPAGAQGFGAALESIGDIDADGVVDIAVGCWSQASEGRLRSTADGDGSWRRASAVHVYSGAHGSWKFTVRGAAVPPVLTALDDWDGDHAPDFVIGWTSADGLNRDCGRVDVVSGRDGHTIQSWLGSDAGDQFGGSLASVPDLDGDGRLDLAIGSFSHGRPGYVRIVSSKGAVLRTLTGAREDRSFGSSLIASTRASEGGETPELFVGQNEEYETQPVITRWNLRTGTLIQRMRGPDGVGSAMLESFPTRLLLVDDRDGDGRPDLLGTTVSSFPDIPAALVSTDTGLGVGLVHVEWRVRGLSSIGLDACPAGDADRDGVGDFAISGASRSGAPPDFTGAVLVVSGKTLGVLHCFTRAGGH